MGDAGFIAGVVIGSAAAFGFVAACLYSAYKAIRDHKRIAEKQAQRREQQLLAISEQTAGVPPPDIEEPPNRTSRSLSTPGLLLEQRRPSAFAPPPQAMERRWTRAGLEYRHEGGVVHIHKTDDPDGGDPSAGESTEDCIMDSNIPYKRHIDSSEPPTSSPRGKTTPGTKAKKLPAVPPPQVQIQVSLTPQSDANGDTTQVEEVTVTPKPVSVRTSGDGSRTQTVTEISSNEAGGNAGKVKNAADWV
ncbi:uncharacterized protein LOC119742465 [Patiria miniata]|uniref:Uncharacterized protein n=1 Tax=Patiria miniata TaxID=46514 RepID=A0A914BDM6_PATMI|nr:uncharacterized protein LOC119742465 [Patiria miniata]